MAVSRNAPSQPNTKTQKNEKETKMRKSDSGQPPSLFLSCSSPSKHTQSPGVGIVRGQIHDSENGKSCHQCRQKTMNLKATCKNQRNSKPCPIKFCLKCLLNRYGEKAEEVTLLDDWKCPKCRGICNCSCCMKKKGSQPTGALAHTAKATGFSSVSEMLIVKGPEECSSSKVAMDIVASPKHLSGSSKELAVASPRKIGKENSFTGKIGKENSFTGKIDSNLQPKSLTSEGDERKIGVGKRKNIRQTNCNGNACVASRDDGSQSEKTSKKSRIIEEITPNPNKKKETNIVGRDNGVVPEIMSSNKSQIPNKSAPNLIKKELKIAEGDDDGLLEKMAPKMQISNWKKNSSIGKIDSNLQPKSLTAEGTGRKIGPSKRKNIGRNDSNGNACVVSKEEGFQLEKTSKKSRIFEEITSNHNKNEEEKMVGRDNGVIPEIIGSNKSQAPNRNASNIFKKELKIAEGDGDGLLEKTDPQMHLLDKIYPEPIMREEKLDEMNSLLPAYDEKELPARPVFHKLAENFMRIDNTYIPLPQGIVLTNVGGINLPAEDVGYALQFLEFCKAFGQVLNMKKGQPESVLRELTRGRFRCRSQSSSIVQFHVQLLSLMQKDSGEKSLSLTISGNSWLNALGKCISESQYVLEDLPLNWFDKGGDVYDKLDSSKKLRLLNFLCDEALGTLDLRSWIDKQNSEYIEREKEVKEKVHAAKYKEKCIKQKMKDEMTKVVPKDGASLSISEHANLVSKIKIELAEAHAEMLKAKDMATKNKGRSDAVRTNPILLVGNGCALWRLKGYSGEPHILLQDIGSWDNVTPQDKWSTYDFEQEKKVKDYISCRGKKRLRN